MLRVYLRAGMSVLGNDGLVFVVSCSFFFSSYKCQTRFTSTHCPCLNSGLTYQDDGGVERPFNAKFSQLHPALVHRRAVCFNHELKREWEVEGRRG